MIVKVICHTFRRPRAQGIINLGDDYKKIKSVSQVKYDTNFLLLDAHYFPEKGSIVFSKEDALKIETKEKGVFKSMYEGEVMGAAIIVDIVGGSGQFSKTTGFITTNFHFNPKDGSGIEEQVSILFYK